MVHVNNLPSIFQRRALLSKESVKQEQIVYQSIAFDSVQRLRDRIFVWDLLGKRWRGLHSYVPFYFVTRTPMLYKQLSKGIQDNIVFFAVDRSILKDQGVLFTDGNASNQQLSLDQNKKVEIVPATVSRRDCRRRYLPDGPHGSNSDVSNFYADPSFLEKLDWPAINNPLISVGDKKRAKQAEVLVPDILPLGRLQSISVKAQSTLQTVNALITENGLAERLPGVVCEPHLFY